MPKLSIIVPTFNEQENIRPIYEAISGRLKDDNWEVIYVDDASSDGTVDKVMALSGTNSNVRLIRRVGRRGLSSACIEGMLNMTRRPNSKSTTDNSMSE